MTTITYKDGIIAFDSRITVDGIVVGEADKGVSTDRYLGAVAGDFTSIPVLRDWVKDDLQGKPKLPKDAEYLMLLIDRKTRDIMVFDNSLKPMTMDNRVFAAGSGANHAYGAMHVGASAKDAVIAAAAYDGHTGGRIRTRVLFNKDKQ